MSRAEELALIEAAVRAGRVTRLPPSPEGLARDEVDMLAELALRVGERHARAVARVAEVEAAGQAVALSGWRGYGRG